MSAYHPHRTITSIPISQSTALAYLSSYLTSSETQPYLLPNARLDPSGGPTTGSSNFSITIHNLRRVEAGLWGEVLAPSLDLNGDDNATAALEVEDPFTSIENDQELNEVNEDKKVHEHDTVKKIKETHLLDRDDSPKSIHLNQELEDHSSKRFTLNDNDKEARKREKKLRRKVQKKTAQSV